MNEVVNPEVSALIGAVLVKEISGERWFDFGRNPTATEGLGKSIADRARPYNPDVVASWSSPEEAVLAHIVANELNVVRASIKLDLGLLSLESELPKGSRIILVSTFWSSQRPLISLQNLLEGQGHTIVAAASLVPPTASASDVSGLPIIRLIV